MLQRVGAQKTSRLDAILQKKAAAATQKSREAQNQKWRDERQALIAIGENKIDHGQERKEQVQISSDKKVYHGNNVLNCKNNEILSSEDKSVWKICDKELVDWFEQTPSDQLPVPPFKLTAWLTVEGPLYFDRLRTDILEGPNGVRARTGALQSDLLMLKEFVSKKID